MTPVFGRPPATARVTPFSPEQFTRRVDEAMSIYVQAMGYTHNTGVQRGVSARRHAEHPGFACQAAVTDDGELIGFGYGYTTAPGQWWHDLVSRAMQPADRPQWLVDAFELSELHVLPHWHGRGIGRRLLVQLADAIAHRSMLLSTPDRDTRAFRLYRDTGFVDLARNYRFPGDVRPFAVLGARLPLHTRPTPQGRGGDSAQG